MTTSGAARIVPIPVDDPDAAAAVEPSPWPVREKKMCHRALLAGSLMTLLLLACFVLGKESPSSAAGLQIDLAKLTAARNNGTAETYGLTMDAPKAVSGDELLGGLLPAGIDRWACRSRYESWWYYKYSPYSASPDLQRKLRAYEARHQRCAPGTPLYNKSIEQLRSGRSADDSMECSYVVWLPFDGLGNRMLSMVSGFLYALLTGRVFLVALPPDSADLFCEPFPGATWRLPTEDFPVANLFQVGQDMQRSYTRLLNAKVVGPDVNATAAGVPAYVYLSLGYSLRDPLFFCGEHQLVLGKINWLLLYSDLYFTPSMYAVAEFQDEVRRLFPEKESVSHLLSRYLFHPSNPVWSLVTEYYHSYLAPATRRIGLQIRMYGHSSIPADDMYNQILSCSQQEHILPETDNDKVAAATGGDGSNSSTAIFIASLYVDYYKRLNSRYSSATRVGVFQRTHEERQATGNLEHNQKALVEIYLLSFCEELVTSGLSTFGYVSSSLAGVRPAILHTAFQHKIPKTPCVRAVSMEPCNLTPPKGLLCKSKPQVKEDVDRHIRVCEDWKNGVKFFD